MNIIGKIGATLGLVAIPFVLATLALEAPSEIFKAAMLMAFSGLYLVILATLIELWKR